MLEKFASSCLFTVAIASFSSASSLARTDRLIARFLRSTPVNLASTSSPTLRTRVASSTRSREAGSAQVTFNAVSQFYGCAFSVNSSHFTVYDCAFLVQCNPVVERIFCELFNAGEIRSRSASTCRTTAAISSPFCIHELLLRLQRSGRCQTGERAIDAAVGPMKIPKSVIDLILPSTRSPLLWVSANCCHGLFCTASGRGDTTTFFVDIQNHHFHYITNVNNFGWVDVFVGPVHFGNVHQTFNAFFDFNEAAVVSQVGNATSQFSTFWVTLSDSYPWIFARCFRPRDTRVRSRSNFSTLTVISSPTFTISLGCLTRFHAMSVMCSRPSTPPSQRMRRSQ